MIDFVIVCWIKCVWLIDSSFIGCPLWMISCQHYRTTLYMWNPNQILRITIADPYTSELHSEVDHTYITNMNFELLDVILIDWSYDINSKGSPPEIGTHLYNNYGHFEIIMINLIYFLEEIVPNYYFIIEAPFNYSASCMYGMCVGADLPHLTMRNKLLYPFLMRIDV